MDEEVIGRDEELAALRAFLESVQKAAVAFVIEGQAGIGKTTLWRAGVRDASERGFRVLATRPAQAERKLSFGALGDVFNGVVDKLLPELPDPQRHALEVALLLEQEAEAGLPPEPRAIAVAVVNTLRMLARATPVLVAVDDVQWLDASSAAALSFAARRLDDEGVRFLLASRVDGDEHGRMLDHAFPEERVQRLDVGPMSVGALHRLLVVRLGQAFSRPVLRRLHEASGGNPFYALEFARALARLGEVAPGEQLPVPASLSGLVAERVSELPPDTVSLLRAAAALANPTLPSLERATGVDVLPALAPAVAEHVVELEVDRVRFAHPLFAAGVYSQLGPYERRELHRRLAEVVGDAEERARHLALAVSEADPEVADILDAAARAAEARGAPTAAAELYALAARHTLAQDEAWRRRLAAAKLRATAGDVATAKTDLAQLGRELPAGRARSEALLELASHWDHTDAGIKLCEEALREAEGDALLEGQIHEVLASIRAFLGDSGAARAHLREAVRHLRSADPGVLAHALGGHIRFELWAGEQVAAALVERALELERAAGGPPHLNSPTKVAGVRLMGLGRLDEARVFLEQYRARAVAYGDEYLNQAALWHLVQLECRAGRLEIAERYSAGALEVARQLANDSDLNTALQGVATVAAVQGRVEAARTAADEVVAIARRNRETFTPILMGNVLGFLELSLEHMAQAWGLLQPLADSLDAMGIGDPTHPPLLPNAIEAAVGVGELEAARDLLGRLELREQSFGGDWVRAACERCRGLIAAASGDLAGALGALDRALEHHSRAPEPLERARTLLTIGGVQRRAKQRRAARGALEQAVRIFEDAGAALWAGRARGEVARISGRTPAAGDLTPTERRVVELVAEGRATKEVARMLFVSPKTVEGHLSHIYAKLGVRSRGELAARVNRPS